MEEDTSIEDLVQFENLVFDCSEESLREASKLLQKFNKIYVQKLIQCVSFFRDLYYKQLANFFALTTPCEIKLFNRNYFAIYLYSRNLIKEDDLYNGLYQSKYFEPQAPDYYEFSPKDGSLEYYILKDDVTNFVDTAIKESKMDELDCTCITFEIAGMIYTQFICYCGSINIIKFMLFNDYVFSRDDIESVVKGGSEEAIELLQSNEYEFHGCFSIAVKHHRNSVAKWLYQNYHSHIESLPFYLQLFNTELFLYFFNQDPDIVNQTNQLHETSLHFASRNNSLTLVKYLLSKGADKSIQCDVENQTPFDVAVIDEMRKLLE